MAAHMQQYVAAATGGFLGDARPSITHWKIPYSTCTAAVLTLTQKNSDAQGSSRTERSHMYYGAGGIPAVSLSSAFDAQENVQALNIFCSPTWKQKGHGTCPSSLHPTNSSSLRISEEHHVGNNRYDFTDSHGWHNRVTRGLYSLRATSSTFLDVVLVDKALLSNKMLHGVIVSKPKGSEKTGLGGIISESSSFRTLDIQKLWERSKQPLASTATAVCQSKSSAWMNHHPVSPPSASLTSNKARNSSHLLWGRGAAASCHQSTSAGLRKQRAAIIVSASEAAAAQAAVVSDAKAASVSHGGAAPAFRSTSVIERRQMRRDEILEDILNWPNAISAARMFSGPLLAWLVVEGMCGYALVGLALAGASDWLDGYVARRCGIDSVFGSYLDPLADKVLIGCLVMAMLQQGLLPGWLVLLVVSRDIALLAGAFIHRAHALNWQWRSLAHFFQTRAGGAERMQPLFISKVNTALQLVLIAIVLLECAMDVPNGSMMINGLCYGVAWTTVASWLAYAITRIKLR
eukprot:TRINITY_DN2430_c0_g1_i2.p1 TRINITY_DN2430_c0_g1~~TRINITY_DN2430_c0_g1_i2.p1  ORF type:complete len:518 (-),score=81.02 TRINITY_DN2430_c0_g1_i2:209-1762(-)